MSTVKQMVKDKEKKIYTKIVNIYVYIHVHTHIYHAHGYHTERTIKKKIEEKVRRERTYVLLLP